MLKVRQFCSGLKFSPCALQVSVLIVGLLIFAGAGRAGQTIVDFDDLQYADSFNLTGTGYAALTWESGNAGYGGNTGYWATTANYDPQKYPHSQPRNVVNGWGCSQIGIAFPDPVDMEGAYIAGQGSPGLWTTMVRSWGYRAGQSVGVTDWFTNISTNPAWFDMSALTDVDRIVFESIPVYHGSGWFGLDDLTFTYVPEPTGLAALSSAAAALLARRRRAEVKQ